MAVLMRSMAEMVYGNFILILMPGIVTQLCHCFKDCLAWLLLQMGRERERDTEKYFATDCSITAKRFITFTCGNYSTLTITVLKLKYSIIGWICYPHEWVRKLHIYESRLVLTARVVILSWHRRNRQGHSQAWSSGASNEVHILPQRN